MSMQDSFSSQREFKFSIYPFPGRLINKARGGETGMPKEKVLSRNFYKRHQPRGMQAEEGGQKREGSGNWAYEEWWKALEAHSPFQRERISPPACSPRGSSNASLGEAGPQGGVHTG